MKKNIIVSSLLVFSFLLPVQVTQAIESLTTAELSSHCGYYETEPNGVDAVFCVRYIQGFIDGAIATDGQVAQNAITEVVDNETFSERAIRLRKARNKSRNPTYLAEFCLGASVPLKSIVEKVILNINKRKFNSKEVPARNVVYHVLRTEYPCEKS